MICVCVFTVDREWLQIDVFGYPFTGHLLFLLRSLIKSRVHLFASIISGRARAIRFSWGDRMAIVVSTELITF